MQRRVSSGFPRKGITTLVVRARRDGTSTKGIGRSSAAAATETPAPSSSFRQRASSRASSIRGGGAQSPTRLVRASGWPWWRSSRPDSQSQRPCSRPSTRAWRTASGALASSAPRTARVVSVTAPWRTVGGSKVGRRNSIPGEPALAASAQNRGQHTTSASGIRANIPAAEGCSRSPARAKVTNWALAAAARIASNPASASRIEAAGWDCKHQAVRQTSSVPGRASSMTTGPRAVPKATRSRLSRLISRGARREGSMRPAARAWCSNGSRFSSARSSERSRYPGQSTSPSAANTPVRKRPPGRGAEAPAARTVISCGPYRSNRERSTRKPCRPSPGASGCGRSAVTWATMRSPARISMVRRRSCSPGAVAQPSTAEGGSKRTRPSIRTGGGAAATGPDRGPRPLRAALRRGGLGHRARRT